MLVTVSDRDWLLPTVTLPKLSIVGFAPSVACEIPVPESAIFSVEFEALEIMLTLPLAPEAEAGVKDDVERSALTGVQCHRSGDAAKTESCTTCRDLRDRDA